MKTRAMTAGLVAVFATSGAAQAFVLNGIRWPGSHPRIPFYVSTNLAGNIPYDGSATFETVVQHIQSAANVWNTQGGAEAKLTYAGTTSVSQVADDGVNAVIYNSGICPGLGGCSAITYYHQTNGVFRGFDIVLYGVRGGGLYSTLWKTQLTHPTQMDLWSIVLHEFGHAAGLDHSVNPGVVMGCSCGPGCVRRNLYTDDINGIRAANGVYTNEGFWSDAATVEPGDSFVLHLDYPRAAGRKFGLYFNAESPGSTTMPAPDSRILPLASPYENARDFPEIFLSPTCLYGGQCQGMFGTLDANGRATVTVQLPADALTALGPDLYLAVVTRNTAMPSDYEDISVGVHVQILGPPPCTSDADCDDSDPCTEDFCDAGSCTNLPYDCEDGDVCTMDSCSEGFCFSEPLACNDNNACTADSCAAGLGCVGVPISCDDGDACTTDSCNPTFGCAHAAMACSDGNSCTADSCDPALGCVYTPIAGCSACKPKDAPCSVGSDCCSKKCRSNNTCGG